MSELSAADMNDLDLETLLLPRSSDQKLKLSFSEAVMDVAARHPNLTLTAYTAGAFALGSMVSGPSAETLFVSTAALAVFPRVTPLLKPLDEALAKAGGGLARCKRNFLWAAKYDRVENACAKRDGSFSNWREARAIRKAEKYRNKAKAIWAKTL